jgi:hypothetical protein
MTDPTNIQTAVRSRVRSMLPRKLRDAADGIVPRAAPRDPFRKASEHIRDAHAELQRLPSRLHDEEGHCAGVRTIRAHVKAASDYLDHYDTSGSNPDLGLDVPPNPEAERSRAIAAALMAGYGATPIKRRRH